jgi:hypothetical protein
MTDAEVLILENRASALRVEAHALDEALALEFRRRKKQQMAEAGINRAMFNANEFCLGSCWDYIKQLGPEDSLLPFVHWNGHVFRTADFFQRGSGAERIGHYEDVPQCSA